MTWLAPHLCVLDTFYALTKGVWLLARRGHALKYDIMHQYLRQNFGPFIGVQQGNQQQCQIHQTA